MPENNKKEYYPKYSDIPEIKKDGYENIRYDNPDFPLFCRRNDIPANFVPLKMSLHWHSDVEFICIRKGHAFYQLDDYTVRMNTGEGIFVNSRQLHLIVLGDEECQLDCIIFHPMLLCSSKYIEEKYVHPIISNPSVPWLLFHDSIPWEKSVLTKLSLLYELSKKKNTELEMIKTTFEIWKLLYDHVPGIVSESHSCNESYAVFQKMVACIQTHYREPISLNMLCKAGGMGRTACTKIFQKYANSTPIDYVRHYRIAKSIELLQSTDMSITKIAYETGFSGASFFTKTFKEITGITPGQMKKGGFIDV